MYIRNFASIFTIICFTEIRANSEICPATSCRGPAADEVDITTPPESDSPSIKFRPGSRFRPPRRRSSPPSTQVKQKRNGRVDFRAPVSSMFARVNNARNDTNLASLMASGERNCSTSVSRIMRRVNLVELKFVLRYF